MGANCTTRKQERKQFNGNSSNQKQQNQENNKSIPSSPIIIIKKLKQAEKEEIVTSFEDIRKVYEFDSTILGHGHYGTVRLASLVKNKAKKFAVKSISKQKIKKDLHLFRRELEILKSMDHPNVIKFYETYQDTKYFHLVMEYCSGGELLERLALDKMITEEQTCRIIKKALIGVKYIHSKGICHRDIKLDNFLFQSDQPNCDIKIIDFGLSTYILNKNEQLTDSHDQIAEGFLFDNELQTMCGTPVYLAPEVIKGFYDQRCDIWSIGIVMFTLLSGELPFYGSNNSEIFEKILNHKKVDLSSPAWKKVSKEAKDLLKKLLVADAKNRISLDDALKHPWFKFLQKTPIGANQSDQQVLNILRNCQGSAKFKKEALKVLVNFLEEDEIKELKLIFKKIDQSNTGMISVEELRSALIQIGVKSTEEEIQNIMKTVSIDEHSREIYYSSFIAATLDEKQLCNKERLWNVFKHFDIDDKNYISLSNIREILARAGRKIENSELLDIMNEVDATQNQQIDWNQFLAIMIEPTNSQCPIDSSNRFISKKEDEQTQAENKQVVSLFNKSSINPIDSKLIDKNNPGSYKGGGGTLETEESETNEQNERENFKQTMISKVTNRNQLATLERNN